MGLGSIKIKGKKFNVRNDVGKISHKSHGYSGCD